MDMSSSVQNNALIQGAGAGFPPRSTGVKCDVGACALVEKNLITARSGILERFVRLRTVPWQRPPFARANRCAHKKDAECILSR